MRSVDLAVILLYLIGITWFGAHFRSSQRTLKDYFLGGRSAPWWAIAFSIVSAETSTLTVIGTPALSFSGNLGFLQLVLGYLIARLIISALFLPHYFRGEMFTAYELMQRRFGQRIRKLTAGSFLVLRSLAEGVRVFAISIVVDIVLRPAWKSLGITSGTGEVLSIVIIVCLTLFYTFEGGMTAVIWTDVVQMFLYIAGAILSFFVILGKIPGGWTHVAAVAGAAGKFQVFDFNVAFAPEFFSRSYTFWSGLIGGAFLTTASHGTEQLMVQRLLAARNQRDSRTALLASWLVIFFQFTLFLFIGIILYVYYGDAGLTLPPDANRIYPEFIWTNLPPVVAGLVIAAILAAAMSNLSAALNALASTTVMDFLKNRKPRLDPSGIAQTHPESYYLRLAKWLTVAWGGVLLLVGIVARHWGNVLEAGLTITSFVYGGLLGVFLLGILTRRVGELAAMAGMTAGLAIMVFVKLGTTVAFTWYVLIGTATTFITGLVVSHFLAERINNA
jgi:solute:Na+ symporter, SSS family